MKLALVPINVRVGDFEGNLKETLTQIHNAKRQGAGFVLFPELSLIGYPSQDLLLRPGFSAKCEAQLDALHKEIQKIDPKLIVIVGTALPLPLKKDSVLATKKMLANCAVFLQGARKEIRAKTLIPFYDVFQEARYFQSAVHLEDQFRGPVKLDDDKNLGILICEDSWENMQLHGEKIHRISPIELLAEDNCDFYVNLSASPFERGKRSQRRETIIASAKKTKKPIFYVNHFGANDEIIFDGDAFAANGEGEIFAAKEDFSEEILYANLGEEKKSKTLHRLAGQEIQDLHSALVTGLRDYAKKNGFQKFVLGLSGGIDSALVATLACDAVGAENVLGLSMPSKFSSSHSLEDAEALANNLGMKIHNFPIKFLHSTFSMALKPFFPGAGEDLTDENLQARLRGVSVMAFSNKFGYLALATGNKSEFAVGYSTLYGDMCGALAPIGDLYKTEVYELAHFLNREHERIPERSVTKAPSAELRPNQTDQDSLPPYELLDAILFALIHEEQDVSKAHKNLLQRFPELPLAEVDEIQQKIRHSEHKRRQAPPILRVSSKAFGIGRQYPITSNY